MDKLISFYQERLHLQNASFFHIEHDEAMVAVVYKITQPSGPPLILKICPRDEDYRSRSVFLEVLC